MKIADIVADSRREVAQEYFLQNLTRLVLLCRRRDVLSLFAAGCDSHSPGGNTMSSK
jgi:hypothetical protein